MKSEKKLLFIITMKFRIFTRYLGKTQNTTIFSVFKRDLGTLERHKNATKPHFFRSHVGFCDTLLPNKSKKGSNQGEGSKS